MEASIEQEPGRHAFCPETHCETDSLRAQNKRIIFGEVVEFDGTKTYDSNELVSMVHESLESECNGEDHLDAAVQSSTYRPMSEKQFYNLAAARGFVEHNGGNYAGYLDKWYAKHADKIPSRATMATAWRQLTVRKQELESLKTCSDSAKVHLAQRNVLVARELYSWASGSMMNTKNGVNAQQVVKALTDYIGNDTSFFDEYRLGTVDYWIVPNHLAEFLEENLTKNNIKCYVMTARHDVMTELVYDEDTVLFSSYVPRNHSLVCTREAGLRVTETVLDEEEMLKRKRVKNQLDRDARKKRRDSGYQEEKV